MEAELEVGFQVIHERYTSQVTVHYPNCVVARVGDSSLFKFLENRWEFQPGPVAGTTWLTFGVEFSFKSALYSHIASVFFEQVAQRMVGAFEARCADRHGPSSLERGSPVQAPSSERA
ncbi:hypothetical protein H632_c169p1 [Helicosporidium sp. ATCC 50920]|nr:hypothetical protein H632_c169p1 [Helicosporidium sp. ATCC 50920]|eukprot:KDD76590.1 hypothetical protein H632_c169p1 [Helicosporidium sp. ATCC 50920]